MFFVLVFGIGYNNLPALKNFVDKGVTPAVAGITVLYGKLSTEIYKLSRLNLGFVTVPPDQDFLFSVRLASYINERRAGPLLDIAVDSRLPVDKRERALMAISKFETTSDWIQPFLNELPKGGLLGMYDDEAPLLDELIKKIRAEGGVRQALVRAYAEVVFSFMLQLPDLVIRKHAAKWVSDVIAEDALFLLIPRFDREKDPQGQAALEAALYNIRAVSEPDTARELLLPFYKKPTWPSLRLPLAVVLARLGYDGAVDHVNNALKNQKISSDLRILLSLASARTPYSKQLKISEQQQNMLAQRRLRRDEDLRQAMARRQQIIQQERLKQAMIARADMEKKPAARVEVVPTVSAPEMKKTEPVSPQQPLAPKLPVKKEEPAKGTSVAKTAERVPPRPFLPPAGEQIESEPVVEKKLEIKAVPEQVAMLPEEPTLPPPLEEPIPKAKSLMNYVDMVFEIKNKDVTLFQNPGDSPTGVVLPVGAKGKAEFEVLIGEDHWYQLKSKKGSGWANGKFLSLFNLSPMGDLPKVTSQEQPASLESARKESTYFEASVDRAPIFEKSSENAKQIGELAQDVAYLAIRSEKVGVDRWFLLQIRSGENGWVRGLDVRLANVQQPVQLEIPTKPLSLRDKKSVFKAEWVSAGVKGVGVYSRPSIVGKIVQQINPADIYKVIDTSATDGKEWYKIELSGEKEGWVQTMDVNLKKKGWE